MQDSLQMDGCRLYSILPAFILLYMSTTGYYRKVHKDTSSIDDVYTSPLYKFWPIKLSIVAMALNPVIKIKALNIDYKAVGQMIVELDQSMIGPDLSVVVDEYLVDLEPFVVADGPGHKAYTTYWKGLLQRHGTDYAKLAQFALRLGDVNCNTAAVEILFSRVKSVHTLERNRLDSSKAFAMAVARGYIRQFGDINADVSNYRPKLLELPSLPSNQDGQNLYNGQTEVGLDSKFDENISRVSPEKDSVEDEGISEPEINGVQSVVAALFSPDDTDTPASDVVDHDNIFDRRFSDLCKTHPDNSYERLLTTMLHLEVSVNQKSAYIRI